MLAKMINNDDFFPTLKISNRTVQIKFILKLFSVRAILIPKTN